METKFPDFKDVLPWPNGERRQAVVLADQLRVSSTSKLSYRNERPAAYFRVWMGGGRGGGRGEEWGTTFHCTSLWVFAVLSGRQGPFQQEG